MAVGRFVRPELRRALAAELRQALKRGRSGSEIILYPDTPHGFFADYRPTYRQQQAEDAWKRLQAWFKQHGVG